jgi:hypothetical protein
MKVGPTSTAKSTQGIKIWGNMQQAFGGCIKVENFARKKIDEKSSCDKGVIPKF